MNDQHAPRFEVAHAHRRGTREYYCDAVAVHTTSDLTTAAAVVDGIGNSEKVAACSRLLAQVAARVAARRNGLAGILSAGELVADAGPDEDDPEPDAVAVVAVAREGEETRVAWVGDSRAYGWTGSDLRQYTTDHTVGEQLRCNGAPLELAEDHDNWLRTSLSLAVVATVYTVEIPDPLVILTSDGVHDSVPHEELIALVRKYQHEPQALADALVAAAQPDEDGYRDDATAVVLRGC
ncbi:hypothetical protein [Sphaerisporangium sp. NPDC051011]|uniref:hypothetical protein n=1 Tax=Sphaerisporangium sp. NPDC051011 TaxID=3155792 RepID=UPI00340CFA42